ncbi:GntR family transcriptional regulator [Nonomuraea sp. M3C6]|uniref:GntR family transcriptional regulator n=1 Tax=Nonomuraea marmarensis TaxID=3351344 RepID=A0ABW7AHY9_9ACTN
MTSYLDRSATEPLHVQLKRALLAEIRERQLRPGDQLPSEPEIENRYRVSRTTIRQALNALASDGVVHRIQGKGTFLREPGVSHVPRLTSFTDNMLAQGHVPSRLMLTSTRVDGPLSPKLASTDDEFGGQCRYLRRLMLADGRPIGIQETWLPLATLGGRDEVLEFTRLADQSLYAVLSAPPINLELRRGVEMVYAGLAAAEEAELLDCATGEALLIAERTSYLHDDTIAEFTRMKFVGNRYVYRVDLAN